MSGSNPHYWIPTAEVRKGDQLAHKLSDTPWTYTEVTGWSDRYLATSDVTHRTFTVTDAPWWVDELDRTADLAGRALIKARPGDPGPGLPAGRNVPAESKPAPAGPGPVTRIVMSDDYHGYRMPLPSAFTPSLLASLDERWAVLESIGIPRRDEVTPLAAWRDAVADETGVPRSELDPEQGGALDMGFTPAYVRTFIFYLA